MHGGLDDLGPGFGGAAEQALKVATGVEPPGRRTTVAVGDLCDIP